MFFKILPHRFTANAPKIDEQLSRNILFQIKAKSYAEEDFIVDMECITSD